jgi:sugar lactone lactonase YvrE
VTLVQGLNVLAGVPSGVGSADGTGANARFNRPFGLAVDNTGTIYVADTENAAIRKITPAGVVTTFAGRAGSLGSADGTGADARFNWPRDIAIDGAGNLYVADSGNGTIRKITPAGVVTTFAGSAGDGGGSSDGTGPAARFNMPSGVATDREGNVFVADSMNHTIRKITNAGVVTTLAGAAGTPGSDDGTGAAARFSRPSGVVVDGTGNVLVADTDNDAIRQITPGGVVTTLAGTAGSCGSSDGTGGGARFCFPCDVAADSAGNIFVADTQSSIIRRISPTGVVTTFAGTPGSGSVDDAGNPAYFMQPRGLAVDGAGNIIVADTDNGIIRRITSTGVVTTLAGVANLPRFTNGPPAFHLPRGVVVDVSGNIFVAVSGAHAIRKVTSTGAITTLAGGGTPGSADGAGTSASFNGPYGIAVDGTGTLFVAEYGNHTIRKVTQTGVTTTLAGTAGLSGSDDGSGTAARFTYPHALAVDGAGNLFVADTGNRTIRKITPAGVVTTFAGTAGSSGSADGTGANARFGEPYGVAVDGMGNVLVADTFNCTIRKITPAGAVTTLAGTPGSPGSVDGTGSAARFNRPQGVAVDGANNVIVADTDNHTIRRITASGVVSTIVGVAEPLTAGNFPGPLPSHIVFPYGVAVDSSTGNLYITVDGAIMAAVFPK